MYYIIYETINLVNGKSYIGYHSTKDLNDNYLGSGTALKLAIEKYGKENFARNILYAFPTKEEALKKEREIVNEEFIKKDDNYNLKYGGEGGWEHTWGDPKRMEGYLKAIREGRFKGWQQTYSQRSKIGKKSFYGKKHTEWAKKKIGEAHLLDREIWNKRLKDFEEIEKNYGWKNKLAKKWGVSHTQVNRILIQLGIK